MKMEKIKYNQLSIPLKIAVSSVWIAGSMISIEIIINIIKGIMEAMG